MSNHSALHIIAPGICGPLAETQSLINSPDINRWINILSKAKSTSSASNVNQVLSSIFNLKMEGDSPSAALILLANNLYNKSKHYMHADLVHLQADMDHAILTSSEDLNVSPDEISALYHSLNQHFNQDGLDFISVNNKQWFVSTENKIRIQTTSLTEAIGRNVNFILPEGQDAMRWKQLLTEAQMLMFSHDVNESRETEGKQAINSLWFHGAGCLPNNINPCVDSLCSNQDMFKGLASHVQCDYLTLPNSVDEYAKYLLDTSTDSVNVLHLPSLEHLVNYTDVTMWMEKLLEQLEGWLYPLLKLAHKNNIKIILYPCHNRQYYFSKYDHLRFWRRGKLEQHVHSYRPI